jgi:hypothetical protein
MKRRRRTYYSASQRAVIRGGGSRRGGTRVFTWNNNHTKPGNFKYSVRVANDNAKAEIDPTIVNH